MKTLAAIPCYKEGLAIGSVVLKARKYVDEVLVVDDGSTDDTVETAREAGATVVAHENNKGKGRAVKNALRYALEHDFDTLVLLDGDGQHDPNEIPLATACAADKRCG
jgi:glycosyltransferase involved in cell wall biosynthesis